MKPGYVMLPGLALLLAFGLTACGGGDTTMQTSTTTIGQELMDLDESYKKGLISEKEYNRTKEAILERYQ